jgi:hypothetical protein
MEFGIRGSYPEDAVRRSSGILVTTKETIRCDSPEYYNLDFFAA